MKKILLFSLSFLVFCTEPNNSDNEPVNPPRMVQKNEGADTLLIERGIDAVPSIEAFDNPQRMQIMWYNHPEIFSIERFRLYRSSDPQGQANFNPVSNIQVFNPSSPDTFFEDSGLQTEVSYYYFVTAVDQNGNESFPSDTVWYQLLRKATLTQPTGNITLNSEEPVINFAFNVNGANPNGFILRIERLIGANRRELTFLYVEEPLSGQNFGKSQITHTLEGDFLQDIFENGVTYRWRIDFVSGDKRHFGSESNWEEFTVSWGS